MPDPSEIAVEPPGPLGAPRPNRLRGIVSRILTGSVMTEVRIDVAGTELVAAVSRHGVERLDLATGDRVDLVLRPLDLMLAKGPDPIDNLTARNQLGGVIASIADGSVMCEVHVRVGEAELVAVVTRYSVERLGLAEGDAVVVLIKATDVALALAG